MKSILKKCSFMSNKNMSKESGKMLSKLENVENFHLESDIWYFWTFFYQNVRTTVTS